MRGRRVAAVATAVVLTAGASASTVVDGASTTHARATTRYSLVHGCYSLRGNGSHRRGIGRSVGPFRIQPAALAVYLLYCLHGRYLIDKRSKVAAACASSTLAATPV